MDPKYASRLTDEHQAEAARRFGADPGSLKALDGFESFIYEFTRAGEPLILRIGHSNRRPVNLVRGEADWINHLVRGGVGAARAVETVAGSLAEPLDDGHGEQFVAAAFVKAYGVHPGKDHLNPRFFEAYGREIGRSHALTKTYRPADPAWQRPHWDDPIHLGADQDLPADQPKVREHFHTLMDHLNGLPKSDADYGLVHFDAHTGNMFVDDQGQITLFDFDDCAYSWFINDIAIVLFYISMWQPGSPEFARDFLTAFFRGYRQENALDPRWLAEIPHFLKLREIDLYGVIYRDFDVENIDNRWVANYMTGRRERIENGVPFIDLDFSTLAPALA